MKAGAEQRQKKLSWLKTCQKTRAVNHVSWANKKQLKNKSFWRDFHVFIKTDLHEAFLTQRQGFDSGS